MPALSFSTPSTGNNCSAKPAMTFSDIVLGNEISLSFDQELMAMVAVSVGRLMTRDIADIDIMDPLLERDIPQFFEG